MMQVHERIKAARLAAHLTEDELAKRLEIKRSTYQYWEKKTPGVAKIKKIAKALGHNEDYFFVKNDEIDNKGTPESQPYMAQISDNLATHELIKAITTVVESNKGLVDSNKAVTDTNRVIADTNAILAQKLVKQESTGSDHPEIPASALATIMALREQVIELTAFQKNISEQEAESALGIKAVAAMKRLDKKDIPVGEHKTSR